MFAPVTRMVTVIERGRAARVARRAASLAPPGGPSYLEVPTDLLAAEVERERRRLDGARAAADRARRRRIRLIDAAERPLIWAGSGARDRADEVRGAGRAARPRRS